MHTHNKLILVCLSLVLVAGCAIPTDTTFVTASTDIVFTNDDATVVHAYVADQSAEHQLGLGNVESLSDGYGMVFVFSTMAERSFWMKNVPYPIDIIWLQDSEIVAITAHVPDADPDAPDATLPTYSANMPINGAIELPAGFSEEHGITVGQTVLLKLDEESKIQ